MQALELILIAGSVIALVAYFAVRQRHVTDDSSRWPRILLGIVPGIIGVALVIVPQADVVPDEAEGAIWIALAIALSAVAIIGTVYRLARD